MLTIAVLWTSLSLPDTSHNLTVSKQSVYLSTKILLMNLSLSMNSLSIKDLQERRSGMATIKSSSESDQTSTVNCEDEIMWRWQTI